MRLLTTLLFFALCATAQAENFSVRAMSDNTFSPDTVAIKPGDSVTFSNDGGLHNVVWVEGTFDDGSQASPADPQVVWPTDPVRTFPDEGTFSFYCEAHGTASGAGMAGKVTVSANPPTADTTPPALTKVRARVRAAVRKGARRTRALVEFSVSEDARVVGSLNRRRRGPDKRLAELDRNVAAGDRVVSFPKRELRSGRYYVLITAIDGAGNRSPRGKASFEVA